MTLSSPFFGQEILERYTFRQAKLGTDFRIIVYSSTENRAQQAAIEAWALVDSLDLIFSNYKEESELSQLNKKAGSDQWISISPELHEVLSFSKLMGTHSNGSFDISIGPLSKLWRRAIRRKSIPDPSIIEKTKNFVGHDLWYCSEKDYEVKLTQKNMLLDLGGVAKGRIVDLVFEHLENKGFRHILVDAGGDMRLGDPPPNRSAWSVKIEGDNKVYAVANVSIACSGDTYQSVTHKGATYSHIVDPKSGYGAKDVHNVVVYASSCMLADAVASTMSICEACERQLRNFYSGQDLKIDIIK